MTSKKMNVEFVRFRLREVAAKDHRQPGPGTEKNGTMSLMPEISFGCFENEKKAPFTIVVISRLSATLKKEKAAAKELPAIQAVIEGEAKYRVTGVTHAGFLKIFDEIQFLDSLADQVYPLVSNRMGRLLNEMGFSTEFPLSLPEIASRERQDAVKDINKPAKKKIPEKLKAD